jgi:hypothetical protein
MKYWSIIIFLFIFSCKEKTSQLDNNQKNPYSKYIGRIINSPKELTEFKHGGGTLLDRHDKKSSNEYSISNYSKGNDRILTFNKLHRSGNDLKYEILDILEIKDFDMYKNYISECTCTINEEIDTEILAIVVQGENEYTEKTIKAWRADRQKEKFIELNVKGIECVNESLMGD